jgi:Big-like domain-containing protein
MSAAVIAMRLVGLLWIAALQQAQPLRKTDLIRVLTGGALSKPEIADLVRRNCLSFTPTPRDRQDLVTLGADSVIMRNVDACAAGAAARVAAAPPPPPTARPRAAARSAPPAATPVRRPVQAAPAAPVAATPASRPGPVVPPPGALAPPAASLPPAVPAPTRTGFVSGLGQRGVVGQRAALPLVFEVRDSAGRPLGGVPVVITVSNGRLISATTLTDSAGQVRGTVLLGERAAPTVVTATVGGGRILRQATLYPAPGPPTRLVADINGQSVDRQLEIEPDLVTNLHVGIQDAFGNAVPGPGVMAAVADEGVLKVIRVTPDSLGATVSLRPGRARGASTTLALQAGAVRLDLRASVRAPSR